VEGSQRLARRQRAETRELLLLAGAMLADETATRADPELLGAWLSHIRLEDVLEVAKQLQLYLATEGDGEPAHVDRGQGRWWVRACRQEILTIDASGYRDIAPSTPYTVFDSEQDYREQLAEALLAAERVNDTSAMETAFAGLVEEFGGPPPFDVMLGELAAVELRRLRELDPVYVEFGAVPFTGHPMLRRLLATTLIDAVDTEAEDSFASLYQQLLDAYGWRMRDGLEVADLVVALYSLVQGYLVFDRLWPEGVRDAVDLGDGGRARPAFAFAVIGIVRRFAVPDPDAPAPTT
jgi:hypothetical protein